VRRVLAIEALAAAQALEFHRPQKTSAPLEAVHAHIRTVAAPWDKDRFVSPDIERLAELVQQGALVEACGLGLE
jgi:histidine ammonia-lyase